jgi:hypothetical protein
MKEDKNYAMYDKERERTRPTPPPPVSRQILEFLPPPLTPWREGKGGGRVVCILSYFMQLTQPHMLRILTFLDKLG